MVGSWLSARTSSTGCRCFGWDLRTHVVIDEPAHTEKTATLGLDAETVTVPGRRNYRIPLPFSVWIQQELPDDKRFVLFMACLCRDRGGWRPP